MVAIIDNKRKANRLEYLTQFLLKLQLIILSNLHQAKLMRMN